MLLCGETPHLLSGHHLLMVRTIIFNHTARNILCEPAANDFLGLALKGGNINQTLLKAGREKNKQMITNLQLNKTEDTFNLLNEYVPGFSKVRAMNAFGLKLKNEADFRNYASELEDAIVKAEIEQRKLKSLQCSYNKTFPSDNKNCLTTPHLLYNTIRSSIIGIRESIKKFCPKKRMAPGTYSTCTQTFLSSFLCNQTPYTPDMYPDMYPEYVKNVLELLEKYFAVATDNILICKVGCPI